MAGEAVSPREGARRLSSTEQELISPTFPDMGIRLRDAFDFTLEPGEEPPVVREPPGHAYRTAAPAPAPL